MGYVLPVIVLSLNAAAVITRQMRSNLLEVIRQDFMTTARSKGLHERRVLYKHGLKNAIIPVIQVIGGIFAQMLSGALINEVIFSIPGVGQYALNGLKGRDYPVIQGSVVFFATMSIIVILLVDISFAYVDPRIRSQFVGRKKLREKRGS